MMLRGFVPLLRIVVASFGLIALFAGSAAARRLADPANVDKAALLLE